MAMRSYLLILILIVMAPRVHANFQDDFFTKLEGKWSGKDSSLPDEVQLSFSKKQVSGLTDYWVLKGTYIKNKESAIPLEFIISIAKLQISSSSNEPFYVMKLVNKRNGDTRRYSLVQKVSRENQRALFLTGDGESYEDVGLIFGHTIEFKFENGELVLSVADSKGYCAGEDLSYCTEGKGALYRLKEVSDES